MAELASRIGKRAPDPPLYGHRTWKRPGLEEEERQKAMPQTISFGNGHSLSSTSKWDGDAMDYDSDASSVNPVESITVASPITTRRPTSTSTITSRSPKIIRNRIKDSGSDGDSSLSLMERLGVGAMAEMAQSPSATPIERGAQDDAGHGAVDGNDASTSQPIDHEASSLPAMTSADMATEDLLIPGLTIAQPQVDSTANVNERDAQEATASTEVTSHSPELINNMRRLLVPLIVKKAEQGLSSANTRSTKTADLAQRADAVVTTEVCDDFIRQAIASVKGLKDVGKIPNDDHLPIQHKNIALAAATRSPTPLPPGLGIKTQSSTSISTPPPSHPTHPGKTMLPDHPTPPSLPRAMRLNVQPNRFPQSPSKDEPPKSPTWKGKEKEIFPTSTRAKSPWRRPRSQSPGPRSASTHRRSPLPTNTGSNFDRRPSPPSGRDPYRQTDDWRSGPPSWKETTNHHPVDPHRRSPPPSSAKDDHGWRGYRHPPSPEAPPFRFPHYKDRERTRTRSPSFPPGPAVDRPPNNKRKAYSPIRRDGPLRGWSKSPPRRETPPGAFRKKTKYNASPVPHAQTWSPEAPPLQEPYGSPPQKRRSGSGPFNGVGGYNDRKQRSSFSYSRRERSPLERGASWRDVSPLGFQPPPPSSAASSTYSSSRRDMNSPQPQPPPPWTAPVAGSGFEPSRQWKEQHQQQQQQQNRFPRSPPPAHSAKPPPAPSLPPPLPPPPRSAGYDASSPLASLPIPKPVPSFPARPQSAEEHAEMMRNGTSASVHNDAYLDPKKGERDTSSEPKPEELPITVDWDAMGHDGQSYENPIELDHGISSSRPGTTVPVMPVGKAMNVDEDPHHRGDDAMEVDATTNTAVGNMEFNPAGFSVATSDDNDNDNLGQPSLSSSGTETAAAATTPPKKRRKRGPGGKVVQENTPKVRPLFEQHMEEEVDRRPDITELERSSSMVLSMNKSVPGGESSSSGSSLLSPSQVVPPPPSVLTATAAASLEPSLHRLPIGPANATVEKELSSAASGRVSTPVPAPAENASTSATNAQVGRAEDLRDADMLAQPGKQAMTLEAGPTEGDVEGNASMQQEHGNDQAIVTLQAQYDEQAQERIPDAQVESVVGASCLQANEADEVMQQAKEQSLEKEARQAGIDIGNTAPEAGILPTAELTGALDDPMQELQSLEQADYGSGDMALETPEPSVELPVPGVWLIQQLPALRVAMTDLTFDIAKETALNWDIAFGDAGSSADAGKKPRTKPKVRLQLLCFANDTLKDVDLSSEELNLHMLQQSWPQPGSLIVQLNVDTPYQRVWLGHDIPEPTGESGRGINLEKYVRAGVNKLRLLQLRDIGEFTLVLVAKPAPLEEPDSIDAALAQLQKDLIQSMEEWKESPEGGIRPLVGRVEIERLGEDEDD